MPVCGVTFQAGCCEQPKPNVNTSSSTEIVPPLQCHCPPCLSRAKQHLNGAVKTVGTLGLLFSLTEVFTLLMFTYLLAEVFS